MKILTIAITLTFALLTAGASAKADTICGQVKQKIVRPHCVEGEMCAQYYRIAHMLVKGNNQIELQTADYDVLTQLVHSTGHSICVEGQQPAQADFFEVTVVAPSAED